MVGMKGKVRGVFRRVGEKGGTVPTLAKKQVSVVAVRRRQSATGGPQHHTDSKGGQRQRKKGRITPA